MARLCAVQYFFRGCTVIVDETQRYIESRFPDGGAAGSTPHADPQTLDVATEMGYADTWTMSRDHELAHTWLVGRGVDHDERGRPLVGPWLQLWGCRCAAW